MDVMVPILPINMLLKDDITKLDHTLIPPWFHGDVRSLRVIQDSLSKLIDKLGEQSTFAQGLKKVITSTKKLRSSPTQTLYLLKESTANGGKGELIGLLKVGRKHLFLHDSLEKLYEVEPLCVLDFFVLDDYQRHGYGRVLFDYMLQDMGISVQDLAIDGPSPKLQQFLAKHYGVGNWTRQSNNFAVTPSFHNKAEEVSKSGRSTPVLTPVLTPASGRFGAPKPSSSVADIIHGGGGAPYRENNNGRVSGRATPVPLFPERRPSEKQDSKQEHQQQHQDGKLEIAIPDLQQNVEKLEVEARPTERPSSLKVGPPSPAGSLTPRRASQLTNEGFFDVKFYHNKLW